MASTKTLLGIILCFLAIQFGCATQLVRHSANQEVIAMRWAIAIHGGAGTIGRDAEASIQESYLAALQVALEAAERILASGGTSLDAVQEAVRILEDDPLFNAGRGAAIMADGHCELDAAVMDGATRNSGAVAFVRGVRNPVLLARHVMEATPHMLVAGDGALRLAKQKGFQIEPDSYFETERRRRMWDRERQRQRVGPEAGEVELAMGTVGAVALDQFGNLAAATSTGGLTNKMPGRVGDSPLVGIGTYANNATCAISCTGTGEEFIRLTVAHRISAMMEFGGLSSSEAAKRVVMEELPRGSGGLILVDRLGNIETPYNSRGMYRATADSRGNRHVAIWE
jgi:isoaspartyl peptidase/L-asparaginase-like protein (Ntn-hydrolase superfamily)